MRYLVYIYIILLMGILTIGCSTPFSYIDKKTYKVILSNPDEKVIIQTPDGNTHAIGYIDYQE